jgi:hypothetical protein
MKRVSCALGLSLVWVALGAAAAEAASWHRQLTPTPSGGSSIVLNGVSCTRPSACIAVGSYVNGSGTTVTLGEAWNGMSWSVIPTANPPGATSSGLNGVSCTAANACTAVGTYVESGLTRTLAESWNGTSWSIQTTPNPALPAALDGVSCIAAGRCEAVGFSGPTAQTLAERRIGAIWSVQPTPNNVTGFSSLTTPNSLSGVSCTAAHSCIAVGQWTDIEVNGDTCPVALHWNGSFWQAQGPACPGTNPAQMMGPDAIFSAVSCTGTSACTGVGNYFNFGSQGTLGERLSGLGWTVQSTPDQTGTFGSVVPNVLTGTSCSGPHTCEAVGYFIDLDTNGDVCPVAIGWDGGSWHTQAPTCPGSNTAAMQGPNARFNAVSCTAEHACTAVGSFYDESRQRALVERYST